MNKYLADSQNKVLRGPVDYSYMESQPKVSYNDPDHSKLWAEYEDMVIKYFDALTTIKAEWLTDSDNGVLFELVETDDKNLHFIKPDVRANDNEFGYFKNYGACMGQTFICLLSKGEGRHFSIGNSIVPKVFASTDLTLKGYLPTIAVPIDKQENADDWIPDWNSEKYIERLKALNQGVTPQEDKQEGKPERTVKPPIGLLPRWRHIELRIEYIDAAIERHSEVNYYIPYEWLQERFELVEWLKKYLPTSPYTKYALL